MIYIHGIGHFHPDNVIDNQFLEDLQIGTTNEWILERVGIQQRRTGLSLDYIRQTQNKNPLAVSLDNPSSNVETGTKAAHLALSHANLTSKDIGMVIAGGCLPQYSMPADACLIAAKLGIQAPAFDINSACATFAVHIHTLNQMQPEALPDYILLVIPENVTRAIDYSDRNTAVLWGDASVAVVVSTKIKSKVTVKATTIASDPAGWNKVMIPTGQHFQQQGSVVQKFAIKKTLSTLSQLRNEYDINPHQHYFIGHQANLLMLNSVCKMANISAEQHLSNIEQFGNCGAAGAPSVLSQNWSRFKAGDTIIMVVVGAGLTWGGLVFAVN